MEKFKSGGGGEVTHEPNGESKSRIDYWLVSDNILRYASQTKIPKALLSDYCFMDLVFEPTMRETRNKGYWKLYARLRPITLLNTDYKVLSRAIVARLKKGILDHN